MMKKEKFVELVGDIQKAAAYASVAVDDIRRVLGDPVDSPVFNIIYSVLDTAIASLAAAVGDEHEWVQYFVYDRPDEDDCVVTVDSVSVELNTAEDLFILLTEYSKAC